MNSFNKIFLALAFIVPAAAFSHNPGDRGGNLNNPGRIGPPADPTSVTRCGGIENPQSTCEEDRQKSLVEGDINQGEYDALTYYNGSPIYTRRGTYQGWCPCT